MLTTPVEIEFSRHSADIGCLIARDQPQPRRGLILRGAYTGEYDSPGDLKLRKAMDMSEDSRRWFRRLGFEKEVQPPTPGRSVAAELREGPPEETRCRDRALLHREGLARAGHG